MILADVPCDRPLSVLLSVARPDAPRRFLGHFSVLIVGGIAQFEFSRRNADEENSGSGRASIPPSLLRAFRHIPSPAICN